ncbi:hypothetical protein EDB89DRAFT_1900214 [Lactarius sanguifluus]|nr:hypothetical protein EDB89DRAFT_1900214 [Lactarius sanguifluus]
MAVVVVFRTGHVLVGFVVVVVKRRAWEAPWPVGSNLFHARSVIASSYMAEESPTKSQPRTGNDKLQQHTSTPYQRSNDYDTSNSDEVTRRRRNCDGQDDGPMAIDHDDRAMPVDHDLDHRSIPIDYDYRAIPVDLRRRGRWPTTQQGTTTTSR